MEADQTELSPISYIAIIYFILKIDTVFQRICKCSET